MLETRPGRPTDRDRAVVTLVDAFAADPALRFFFPGEAYPGRAAAFFGYLYDTRLDGGEVWVGSDGEAVALWEPPEGNRLGEARAELWAEQVAPVLDAESLRRYRRYEEAVERLLADTDGWYLGVVGISPRLRGRRYLRSLLDPVLSRGEPARLETTNPDNVAVYRRLGFEVTGEASVDQLTIWAMRRP